MHMLLGRTNELWRVTAVVDDALVLRRMVAASMAHTGTRNCSPTCRVQVDGCVCGRTTLAVYTLTQAD